MRREIIARRSQSGDYEFSYADPNYRYAGIATAGDFDRAMAFVNDQYKRNIRTGAGFLTNGQYQSVVTNLSGMGRRYYDSVMPPALRQWVENLETGAAVVVVDDELEIPWELIRNGGDFWGRRFVMSRCTPASTTEVHYGAQTERRVRRILNVIGAGLPKRIVKEAEELFDGMASLGVTVVTLNGQRDADAVGRLLSELPGADIVHFTCHGQIAADSRPFLQIGPSLEPVVNLMVDSVALGRLREGAIVFANACISGASGRTIGKTLGFGTEFFGAGAAAFVGTLDYVADEPAMRVARAFYTEMLGGASAGEALMQCRRDRRSEDGLRLGVAQLLYSLYGNADAYLSA